ncbi:carbohydrate sulfotransferase 11-like [Penaeus chinensis]|uniref:carbohydrate sulfotransferase 11-like n=1 Tax=Penaeus chinensis TaxID=139456 RepID=UPI001FB69C76|nr:carbohydrate sulfotransferase 11-like [Penaeus chinensis]
MSASSTTFSGLARKLTYLKRSGLLWFIGVVSLMLVAHMSLARMQSTNSWTLISENSLPLPPPENAHVCGETCIETFIDEFIMANTNYEDGAAKEAAALDDSKQDEETDEKDETEEGEIIMPTRGRDNKKNIYKKDTVREVTWTEEMSKAREAVLEARRSEVEERCRSLNNSVFLPSKESVYNVLRWVTEHDFVWCPIFKAASTSWVKNLLLLAKERFVDMSLHGRVRELYPPPETESEKKKVLEENMKLMIVRHPLERLLSAYRDKMLRIRRANDPFRKMQLDIAKRYPDPTPQPPAPLTSPSGEKEIHPTFTQFLLRVQDDLQRLWKKKGKSQVNLHWRPFWFVCSPCEIHYDVIAHVETMDVDNEYVIHKLGLQDVLVNVHTHASNFDAYNDTSAASKDYFRQVPYSLLKDIVRLYQPDFTLFGYSPDAYLKLAWRDDR